MNSNPLANQKYYHHILVDTHASRSHTFSQAFEKQESLDCISLKKLLLRSMLVSMQCGYLRAALCGIDVIFSLVCYSDVFSCLLRNVDLVKLDKQLEVCTYCLSFLTHAHLKKHGIIINIV